MCVLHADPHDWESAQYQESNRNTTEWNLAIGCSDGYVGIRGLILAHQTPLPRLPSHILPVDAATFWILHKIGP